MARVLVVATSRKTRGGITSVVKAHETGEQWKKYHCKWIETHRDGPAWRKVAYFVRAMLQYVCYLPFTDIVHIHCSHAGSITRSRLVLRMARCLGKKTIVHFHPPGPFVLQEGYNVPRYRFLFAHADRVIVLSEQWKRWIREYLCEEGEEWLNNVVVLYNPCPSVRRYHQSREKIILQVGFVELRKGYDVTLKAFALIAKRHPDWQLQFAGTGEIEKGNEMIRQLGLEKQVKFLGWVGGADKEVLFNKASIYCLASTGEGFPMAVLDAWSYGIPCIMTPVGGIPDIVRDGEEGLLFPVGDVGCLAQQMERLINDEELRKSIVSKADVYVNGLFDVKQVNQRLGKIYQALLDEK